MFTNVVAVFPHSSATVIVTAVFAEISVPATGDCVIVKAAIKVQLSVTLTKPVTSGTS